MNFAKMDPNFKIETEIKKKGLVYYNIDEKPFKIHGIYRDEDSYSRIPKTVTEPISTILRSLSKHTAGGRVRFTTDSPYIAIKVVAPPHESASPMAYSGRAGVDMYVNCGYGERYKKTFLPPIGYENGYEGVVDFGKEEEGLRTVTLNLPLFTTLFNVYVGLHKDSHLLPPPEYKITSPIVYYGSSITQGACASRPGMAYESILSRELDADFINLGFAGNAKGEPSIAEYISTLEMSAFVYDYDFNSPSPETLLATHQPFFDIIRKAQPNLPIIIMPKPRYYRFELENKRASIIRATYDSAISSGDKNVYFIDGPELMGDPVYDNGVVDGTHPTDLGFMSMARAILPMLKKALSL